MVLHRRAHLLYSLTSRRVEQHWHLIVLRHLRCGLNQVNLEAVKDVSACFQVSLAISNGAIKKPRSMETVIYVERKRV